jgi:hypothetical protein
VAEGLYDEQEEQRMEKDNLAFKNTLLVPLYQSIRSIIAKLKASELDAVYEDLQLTIDGLERTFGVATPEFQKKRAEAEHTFLALIKKIKGDLDKPKAKLYRLRQQLLLVVNLLLKWREYTKVLHMSFASTRQAIEETQMTSPASKSPEASTPAMMETAKRLGREYLDPADESTLQQRMEEMDNTDFERQVIEPVGDFFDQYRDVLAPFMDETQIKQIENDFSRLREAGVSAYGDLRHQKQVTSDEFFKNILSGQQQENKRKQNELQQAQAAAGDTVFGLLNLVYKSVGLKGSGNAGKHCIQRSFEEGKL